MSAMLLAIAAALIAAGAVVLALTLGDGAPVERGPRPPRTPAHAISADPREADVPSAPETDTAPSASPAFTR